MCLCIHIYVYNHITMASFLSHDKNYHNIISPQIKWVFFLILFSLIPKSENKDQQPWRYHFLQYKETELVLFIIQLELFHVSWLENERKKYYLTVKKWGIKKRPQIKKNKPVKKLSLTTFNHNLHCTIFHGASMFKGFLTLFQSVSMCN